MNTIVTSKSAILAKSRELAAKEGLNAISMRRIAQDCGVSVGSIYNYFPSKTDLVAATVENVWQDIFHDKSNCHSYKNFPDGVMEIIAKAQVGISEYSDFFTMHSLGFAGEGKGKGRQLMAEYFDHMKSGLLAALQNDPNLSPNAFDDEFTQSQFIDFVFLNILSLLLQKEPSSGTLLGVIKRIIYR